MVQQHTIETGAIQEIRVTVNPGVQFLLIHPRPKTGMEAKFSLDYCVARAILDKEMGPDQFAVEKIQDPALQQLIETVKPCYEEKIGMGSRIQIKTVNGESYVVEVTQAKGWPGSPLADSDLEKKFYRYAGVMLEQKEIDKILEQLVHFEQIEDIDQFITGFNRNALS
jgi:2-methylcitrate dehydratase PrpD